MSDNSDKPKRKRRRRGGLRVPSDKVPRTKSNPEISVPESEDPRLAMSVAYAFGSGPSAGAESDVRDTIRNQPTAAAVANALEASTERTGAPEMLDESNVEDGVPEAALDFEPERTIELDSVADLEDVEPLDGEQTEAAANHPKTSEADDDEKTVVSGSNMLASQLAGSGGGNDANAEDERVTAKVASSAIATPSSTSANGEIQSTGKRADSVDIAFDDETPPPVAPEPASGGDTGARFNRARTVALSDSDLEELMESEGVTLPFTDGEVKSVRIEPRARQGIPEPRDAGDSGEIIADDMIEEIEENAVAKPVELLDDDASSSEAVTPPEADSTRKRAENSEPPPPPPAAKVKFKKSGGTAEPADGAAVDSVPEGAEEVKTATKPPPAPAPVKAVKPASSAKTGDASRRARKGKPWFEEIFDENYLRTLPFLTPQATEAESDFVLAALGLEPGGQILDVGCGYGRHSMELAARGYHVVGLDTSLPLLLRGADEAQRRGLNINFVHGDMREMQFDSQFDGAFCLFETFGYFDDETNKATAKNIAKALKPGAKVVLDVLNRDYLIRELPTRVWWEGDGCVVLEEVDFNYFSSRITSKRSIAFEDGRQLEQEISIRAFALHELGKVLHAAGFRVVEVSGSMYTRGRFFGAHSRDIIVVAEKRA